LYGTISTLFYAGAQFNDKLNTDNDPDYPIHVFITIFAMMFGALEAG
jgi:hypothetical protein